eukprot:PLAT10362.1.p1 GENE.PLAT10362.1~~PLAT10362.1.p1  ORF type:complete len:677 (+),score=220.17 PLAT10362.1:285-2033(+)
MVAEVTWGYDLKWSALHVCAAHSSASALSACLTADGSERLLSAVDSAGLTALQLSISKLNESCAVQLIEASSAEALAGLTLHDVARNGLSEALSLLIARGCEVNAVDAMELTALHVAARNDELACVRTLLAAGAEPLAIAPTTGLTPLAAAAQSASVDVVSALLAADGAAAAMAVGMGRKKLPLVLAAERDDCQASFLLLLREVENGEEALRDAFLALSRRCDVDGMQAVLQVCEAAQLAPIGHVCVMHATRKASPELLQLLVAAGLIDTTIPPERSPIVTALQRGDERMAQLLAAVGYDLPSARRYAEQQQLQELLYSGLPYASADAISLLDGRLELVQDIELICFLACSAGQQAFVHHLLQLGLKPSEEDVVAIVADKEQPRLLADIVTRFPELASATADGITALHWACRERLPGNVRLLVEACADASVLAPAFRQCNAGSSALVVAASVCPESARLVAPVSEVLSADEHGWTALAFAAVQDFHAVVLQLLALGADGDWPTRDDGQEWRGLPAGCTALRYAIDSGSLASAYSLAAAGCSGDSRSPCGTSALMAALAAGMSRLAGVMRWESGAALDRAWRY